MDDRMMRKNIIKRNIRYWGRQSEKTIATLLLVSFIYGIIFFSAKTSGTLLYGVVSYFLITSSIFMAIQQIGYTTRYLPMALSFGAGRRETVWGMQFANLLMLVQLLLLSLLGFLAMEYAPGSDATHLQRNMGLLCPAFASILLLSAAMGQFAAVVKIRFEKIASAIFMTIFICFMIAVCCAGSMLLFPLLNDGYTWLLQEDVIAVIRPAGAVVGIVGGICYLAGFVLMKRTVLQYEVRR